MTAQNDPQKTSDFDSVLKLVYTTVNEQLSQLFKGMVKSATGKLVSLDGQPQSFEDHGAGAYQKQAVERESIRYLLSDVNELTSNFFTNLN